MNFLFTQHAARITRLSIALLLLVTGCDMVGVGTYKLVGPPTVHPKFSPLQEPSVVMAENYRDPSAVADDADRLAQILTDEFKRHEAVMPADSWIDPAAVATLRTGKPREFGGMTVAQVGAAVGARQVLYVDLTGVDVGAAAGGSFYKGRASALVKWVDCATGRTDWPTAAEGFPVSFETGIRSPSDQVTPDSVRVRALRGLSGNIARLFYPYKPDEVENPEKLE